MHGFGMGWMWLWWLLPLFIIAAFIYIITARNAGESSRRARDILDERLARGEIDIETYEKLKAELEKEAR